jgi:hypothetical protein
MEQGKKEVCTIHIMFPIDTDEEALNYKKKISAVLSEVPNSNIEFRLTEMPTPPKRQNDLRQ